MASTGWILFDVWWCLMTWAICGAGWVFICFYSIAVPKEGSFIMILRKLAGALWESCGISTWYATRGAWWGMPPCNWLAPDLSHNVSRKTASECRKRAPHLLTFGNADTRLWRSLRSNPGRLWSWLSERFGILVEQEGASGLRMVEAGSLLFI